MKKTLLSRLGNIASADFYLYAPHHFEQLSDNQAFNTASLATKAIKLSVPKALTIVNLSRFYIAVVPITAKKSLLIIPHLNSININQNSANMAHFITNITNLSALTYQLLTDKKPPTWPTYIKKLTPTAKTPQLLKANEVRQRFNNEQEIYHAMQELDRTKFLAALKRENFSDYMGNFFEKQQYNRGKKDLIIRFISLLVDSAINSGKIAIDTALKIQDNLLGTVEFKQYTPPFELWLHQIAVTCFNEFKALQQTSNLPLPEKANQYIQNHIAQRLSTSQLATALGCSASTLTHSFTNYFGTTITERITIEKIKATKCILLDSTLHISEIAYTLSFSSPEYFTKTFKKVTGLTPSRFRQEQRT